MFQYISCYSLSSISLMEWSWTVVSIHLMLLFIRQYHLLELQYCRFNTSHVTLYPSTNDIPYTFNSVSIHLMLLFIGLVDQSYNCYYLCFNTSHVTLYLSSAKTVYSCRCFNTSHVTLYRKFYRILLQIIRSFNTSHVTLYHNTFFAFCISHICFNTSHVTLYLKS